MVRLFYRTHVYFRIEQLVISQAIHLILLKKITCEQDIHQAVKLYSIVMTTLPFTLRAIISSSAFGASTNG